MEWNAERRARWLYHNQANIEREAYERGIKDASVAAEIAKLEAAKAARDPNYVDPEFTDDPSIIMDPNYVEAVYNPEVVEVEESSGVGWFFIIVFSLLFAAVFIWLLYWLVFKVRFGGK